MLGDHAAKCAPRPVCGGWKQVLPEVARPQTGDDVDEAGQNQGPCCLKVEIPAPAILVRQHVSVASRDGRSRRRDRYLEQRSSARIADFAPIEARVRDQDLNASDQQSNERNYCDPVRHPDEQSMPGRSLISQRGSVRHPGSIARSGAASPVLSSLASRRKGGRRPDGTSPDCARITATWKT